MSGDYSRKTFDPFRDFSGVLMQQGRVQLDADWNELVGIISRRLRAETTDIIGRGTVPKETPDGFKIEISGGTLTIGRGRIYVDGLLAENHGKPPLEFDTVLSGQRGTLAVPYDEQPYFPNAVTAAPAPTEGGPYLVYLDVWQREVTYLQVPELIEKAVGGDTATRLQTVWQVRVLGDVGTDVTCDTPDGGVGGWLDIIRPSDGRLSTDAVGVVTPDDPCVIPPSGGYRGLENRLYRVEIHDGGTTGTATFKWSQNNASIATSVTAITALDKLTVTRVGRDNTLRFKVGDWIEITDDFLEFAQQSGLMRQIEDVDDATQIITLTEAQPAGMFPTDAQGNTDPKRHTRVTRWDQEGKVTDTNNNLLVDLDAPGSKGVIPVPAQGTSLILEDGVQITFDTPANGIYRVGDFWCFVARTADASVEKLVEAPPRGIHHHYCRLAVVTFPDPPTDCRHLWPPPFGEAGCDCSVCVTAESHNSGTLTIQQAIDQVKDIGGTVCLGAGLYNLSQPIQIKGAASVRLKGQGWLTILFSLSAGLEISNSARIIVEDLSVIAAGGGLALGIFNSAAVTLQRSAFVQFGRGETSTAIALAGFVIDVRICDNVIFGANGVATLMTAVASETLAAPPLLIGALRIQDNFIYALSSGIALGETVLHLAENRLAGNFITGCAQAGIDMRGKVFAREFPGSRLDIHRNIVRSIGSGIVIGTDETRITDNDIAPNTTFARESSPDNTPGSAGILLTRGRVAEIEHCQILENRVNAVGGVGIGIETTVRSAMIKQNIIDGAAGGGIVMDAQGKAAADILTIENNQILNVADSPKKITSRFGIAVVGTRQAAIVGNTVIGVGLKVEGASGIAGIAVSDSYSIRISGNTILNIGPAQAVKQGDGIVVFGSFDRVDVIDNEVQRQRARLPQGDNSTWHALSIGDPKKSSGAKLVIENESTRFILLSTGIFKLARDPQAISVRGNAFAAYGSASSVILASNGACLFSDNRCFLVTATKVEVAYISGGAIIANANYFERSLENDAAVVVLDVRQDKNRVTVLGNISNGSIRVNNSELNAPWKALNVMA